MSFRAVPVFFEILLGTVTHLGAAIRMAWPWLLLLVPLQIAVSLYQVGKTGSAPEDLALGNLIVSLAHLLIASIAGASVGVNWHRYLLLDEEAAVRLRLDGPVWRYVGNCLLLMLPLLILLLVFVTPLTLVLGVAFLGGEESTAASVSLTLVMLLGTVVPIAVLQRLSLKFPAIALGRDDYGFRDSWHDTRGYFLPIIGFTLLTIALSVPMTVLFGLWVPDAQTGSVINLFHALLSTAWGLFMALFAINTLTVFYAIFVDRVEI